MHVRRGFQEPGRGRGGKGIFFAVAQPNWLNACLFEFGSVGHTIKVGQGGSGTRSVPRDLHGVWSLPLHWETLGVCRWLQSMINLDVMLGFVPPYVAQAFSASPLFVVAQQTLTLVVGPSALDVAAQPTLLPQESCPRVPRGRDGFRAALPRNRF